MHAARMHSFNEAKLIITPQTNVTLYGPMHRALHTIPYTSYTVRPNYQY